MSWKSARERFEENYMCVTSEAGGKKKTQYTYYAPWYNWDISRQKLNKIKILAISSGTLQLLMCIGAGLMRTASNGLAWVEVPAILALVVLFFELYGIILFAIKGMRLKRHEFEDIRNYCYVAPAVFSILEVLAGIANIAVCIGSLSVKEIMLSAIYFVCGGLSVAVAVSIRKIKYTSEKNTFK